MPHFLCSGLHHIFLVNLGQQEKKSLKTPVVVPETLSHYFQAPHLLKLTGGVGLLLPAAFNGIFSRFNTAGALKYFNLIFFFASTSVCGFPP